MMALGVKLLLNILLVKRQPLLAVLLDALVEQSLTAELVLPIIDVLLLKLLLLVLMVLGLLPLVLILPLTKVVTRALDVLVNLQMLLMVVLVLVIADHQVLLFNVITQK